MEPSPDQEIAIARVVSWFRILKRPRFVLGGPAGSGKSFCVEQVQDELHLDAIDIAYIAYTGKAAMRLRRRGINATTMHKFMYVPEGSVLLHKCPKCKNVSLKIDEILEFTFTSLSADSKSMIQCIDRECKYQAELTAAELILMSAEMDWEMSKKAKKRELKFRKRSINEILPLPKLIVVDEASMINEFHQKELEAYGIPVLYVGDQFQLPPIQGKSLVATQPDFLLTQIHRQAEGNPIIQLSMMVRSGQRIPLGKMGANVLVCRPHDISLKTMVKADQVICGKNDTRRSINDEMREYFGRHDRMPCVGDKVICTRNNWTLGIVNGQIGTIVDLKIIDSASRMAIFDFLDEDDTLYPSIKVDLDTLTEKETQPRKGFNGFQYGNAISCHKFQGSEANKLIIYEEQFMDNATHILWCYTAVTRAIQRLIWLKP
jgi:exodeoxyribonuclease-5